MVATRILQEQRGQALVSLRDTLLTLDGVDPARVEEIHARGRAGQTQVTEAYLTAQYLSEIVSIIADQQERIRDLEAKVAKATTKATTKTTTKKGGR